MKTITKALAALLVLASFVMLTGCNKPSSEKRILSYKFYEPEVEATIMESAKTVIATVPAGTDVTALVPIITVSDNATVNPASGIPQNFTNPKTYTVMAEDGTQASYTVTVVLGNGGGGNGDDNGDDNGGEEPQNHTISVAANPTVGGTVTGGGTFQEGQSCTVTATTNDNYLFENWTENGSVVSTVVDYTFIVAGNRSLVANFIYYGTPEGVINGKFTINDSGDQVYFSQGNLQFQASSNTWQFAENQYNYVGSSNSNISSIYEGWIDLFGWGTSGWNSGANCYQPWSTSTNHGDYYPGGNYTNNLTGSYANADWGVYNAISNGGNQVGLWRTLTEDEWVYVFNVRNTTSGIRYAKAKVNDENGVILLPDDWNSGYYNLSNANTGSASFSSNTISLPQWNTLEQHGAVFLPVAGYRYGASVSDVGNYGGYWSASYYGSSNAYSVHFSDDHLQSGHNDRYFGFSVRLVCSAQ